MTQIFDTLFIYLDIFSQKNLVNPKKNCIFARFFAQCAGKGTIY